MAPPPLPPTRRVAKDAHAGEDVPAADRGARRGRRLIGPVVGVGLLLAAAVGAGVGSSLTPAAGRADAVSPTSTAAAGPRSANGDGRPDGEIGRIGVVGDSVLDISQKDFFGDGSKHHVTDAFSAAGLEAAVSSHPGLAIRELAPYARQLRDEGADVIVVEGGHNDARLVDERGGDPAMLAQVQADLVRLLDSLDAVRCVVLVTPRTATGTWSLDTVGPQLLDAWTAAAADHPNVHLADWTTPANAHPEWFIPDGVHPVQEGATALQHLLVDAVRSSC